MKDDRLRILVWHIRDVASEIADFVASHTREQARSNLFLDGVSEALGEHIVEPGAL